ncbi:Tetratricopeptide-like helical [Artemisia annua]|uniref:Tetratricopeptide-like helical n=1 Tax=Artemisia annua TaxID=35608 RepID=A0A2U1L8D7_ARTAN|nr:Tetratricopeptide-like helical [Artemisia annua]
MQNALAMFPDYVDAYLSLADRQLAPLLLLEPQFPEYVDAYLRLAAIAKARNNVPLSIEMICDAVEVDDKNLDALCLCLVTWSLKTMTGLRQKI